MLAMEDLESQKAEVAGRISSIRKVAKKLKVDWDLVKRYYEEHKAIRKGGMGAMVTDERRYRRLLQLMGSPLGTQFTLWGVEAEQAARRGIGQARHGRRAAGPARLQEQRAAREQPVPARHPGPRRLGPRLEQRPDRDGAPDGAERQRLGGGALMEKQLLCIYHGNCDDGFGAAWVARRALGAECRLLCRVYQKRAAGRDGPRGHHGRLLVQAPGAGGKMAEQARSHADPRSPQDCSGGPVRLQASQSGAPQGISEGIWALFDMNRSGAGSRGISSSRQYEPRPD
jgi:hypothetical protein